MKPKKVQRTIDRLQPGKSKGNLLSKKLGDSSNNEASDKQFTSEGDQAKSKDADTEEPKLSLGSVLKNADSIQLICKSIVSSPQAPLSNEADDDENNSFPATPISNPTEEQLGSNRNSLLDSSSGKNGVKEDNEIETETATATTKPKVSATPNLSAW